MTDRLSDLFDLGNYDAATSYTREPPQPWWTAVPTPRFKVEGSDPRALNYGAGVDFPLGRGTFGIDTRFDRKGLQGFRGTWTGAF
jgi:hypothetical protein